MRINGRRYETIICFYANFGSSPNGIATCSGIGSLSGHFTAAERIQRRN
jgi:hypothetical protein